MKQAVVIRHVAFEDLGNLESVLLEQDFDIRYLEAGLVDFSDIDPSEPDLVISLGGPISVNDDGIFPFLRHELRILRERMDLDLPTLGICLGAQLMAKAMGAGVKKGISEIGWGPLMLTDAGKRSAIGCLSQTEVFHWHGEILELPEGAVSLAATSKTPHQAFQWRRRGLGLQFHPEVSARNLERWYIGHSAELSNTGIAVADLRRRAMEFSHALQPCASQMWNSWLRNM